MQRALLDALREYVHELLRAPLGQLRGRHTIQMILQTCPCCFFDVSALQECGCASSMLWEKGACAGWPTCSVASASSLERRLLLARTCSASLSTARRRSGITVASGDC